MDLRERMLLRGSSRGRMRARRGASDSMLKPYNPYWEDLGFRLGEEQHASLLDKMKAVDTEYQAKLKEYEKSKGALGSEYQAALNQLNGSIVSPKTEWNKVSKTFIPVRVYTHDRFEGEYRLPKDVIDKLNSTVFNQGDGSYVGNWKNGGKVYNVDTVPRGTSSGYGKELHDLLAQTSKEVYKQFMDEANKISKESRRAADKQKAALSTQYEQQLGVLDAQKETLDSQYKAFYKPIEDKKRDYQDKLKKRRQLFGVA